MSVRGLEPVELTREAFLPFGQVIETSGRPGQSMNEGRFERFDDVCDVEVDPAGRVSVSITRSRRATSLPYRFDSVERHPLGSQAFVPLTRLRFVIVVAPARPRVDPAELRAFVTNGRQGVSYRRGIWHMPLIALEAGQEFLVIDRAGELPNCEVHVFDEPILLQGI